MQTELPVLLGVRMAPLLPSRGPSAGFPWGYGLPQLRNSATALSLFSLFKKSQAHTVYIHMKADNDQIFLLSTYLIKKIALLYT